MFSRVTSFAFVVVLSVALGSACGGKSKPANNPPPPKGGGEVQGETMGGGAYGGAMYGAAPAGTGAFDCVSGVKECDEFFQKLVACAKGSDKLDEATRGQIMDTMQQACEQVKQAATSSPDQVAQVGQVCAEQAQQAGPQAAEQLGCTW
jgi:hypothetical protein